MDRIMERVWCRHGTVYAWVVCALAGGELALNFGVWAYVVLRLEDSHLDLAVVAIGLVSTLAATFLAVRPTSPFLRGVHRWAAGDRGDSKALLRASYEYGRATPRRATVAAAATGSAHLVGLGIMADSPPDRLLQFGAIGALALAAVVLTSVRGFTEMVLRPIRRDLTRETDAGDALPRARPSYATWAMVSLLSTSWIFGATAAGLALAIDDASDDPMLVVTIATALLAVFAAIVQTTGLGPSLKPLQDLEEGASLVQHGDFSRRLPVVQDDDLGVLSATFNRMQAGLAERRRLETAFGSYVDPALAARLLEQGDDIFRGDRVPVTVLFVDIRDFTPFAESNTAEVAVAQLNALFEIVVPAVLDLGGHVNKFLGDGALAVFGAPNRLDDHADAALAAARRITRLVDEQFDGALRIGIGINSGTVIAGTIGGGGKLEFTLIGDAVNVAARVEQLTKVTGDTVLLTRRVLDAAGAPQSDVIDRGLHELKGKTAPVSIYALVSAP